MKKPDNIIQLEPSERVITLDSDDAIFMKIVDTRTGKQVFNCTGMIIDHALQSDGGRIYGGSRKEIFTSHPGIGMEGSEPKKMSLREELKASGRYEYGEDEMSFNSHKYRSNIIFMDDPKMTPYNATIDSIQYVRYNDANPEGNVFFEMTTEISLEKLEEVMAIAEAIA